MVADRLKALPTTKQMTGKKTLEQLKAEMDEAGRVGADAYHAYTEAPRGDDVEEHNDYRKAHRVFMKARRAYFKACNAYYTSKEESND